MKNIKVVHFLKRLSKGKAPYLPDIKAIADNTIKLPLKRPNLKVVHGFVVCSPNGGTLNRFIALWRSPPSRPFVTNVSVSRIIRSISLFVAKCDVSTHSVRHLLPASDESN